MDLKTPAAKDARQMIFLSNLNCPPIPPPMCEPSCRLIRSHPAWHNRGAGASAPHLKKRE
jgi:hypothetical protein